MFCGNHLVQPFVLVVGADPEPAERVAVEQGHARYPRATRTAHTSPVFLKQSDGWRGLARQMAKAHLARAWMSAGRALNSARNSLVVDDLIQRLGPARRNIRTSAVKQPLQSPRRLRIGGYRLVPRVHPLGLKAGEPGEKLVEFGLRQPLDLVGYLLNGTCYGDSV